MKLSQTRSLDGQRTPFAGLTLVVACSGQPVAAPLPASAPRVDMATPPPGVADRGDDPAILAVVGDLSPCAGALLAPDVILLGRHCVSVAAMPRTCPDDDAAAPPLRAPGSLRVLVGDDLGTAAERARGRAIVVPDDASLCGADIALLLLDQPIDELKPLIVRLTGAAQGDHLRTVGWSRTAMVESSSPGGVPGPAARKILRDHLEVLSASPTELQLAEAVAGGGGPALDEATGDVVGVFSRSSADPSRALYTRSDVFVALIEGALAQSRSAVAASTGLAKSKTGPADLGANCATGADCAAGVCLSVSGSVSSSSGGSEQYCSQTCGPLDHCPTRFRCERSRGEPSAGEVEACVESIEK